MITVYNVIQYTCRRDFQVFSCLLKLLYMISVPITNHTENNLGKKSFLFLSCMTVVHVQLRVLSIGFSAL